MFYLTIQNASNEKFSIKAMYVQHSIAMFFVPNVSGTIPIVFCTHSKSIFSKLRLPFLGGPENKVSLETVEIWFGFEPAVSTKKKFFLKSFLCGEEGSKERWAEHEERVKCYLRYGKISNLWGYSTLEYLVVDIVAHTPM